MASSRLSLREDGRVEYRLKRALPNGCAALVLTPLELLKRLAALVPPPRRHLLHFYGGLAPNAKVRPKLVALAKGPEEEEATAPRPDSRPQAELPLRLPAPARRPRLDWASLLRRTFAIDVFTCGKCGGARRVMGVVNNRDTARRVLEALGLYAELPATTGPPRRAQLELPLAARLQSPRRRRRGIGSPRLTGSPRTALHPGPASTSSPPARYTSHSCGSRERWVVLPMR